MDAFAPRTASSAATTAGAARLRVAIVAPSMRILGGQAVQAERLLRAWQEDPDVTAWLVPINPLPPRGLRWTLRVKYLRTIVTQLAYLPLLARELARADVVHVFSASYFSFLLAPLPAVVIAKALQRPVILNYRSGEAPDHLTRSAIARLTVARVDRNVVPSAFLQGVFASFGLPAHVVPNIVDVDRFRFRPRDRVTPNLVSTRNFEDLYNVACTLRAFRLVQNEYPGASLTLVGAGSREPSLRALAESLSLRNVMFVGRVAPEEIWRHYADADIYVQTPDIDNMPSSVLEAFSSGVPVVSTDAGGVPAIVTDEVDGLLAPVGDHEAVARQVLRLLREPGLAARLASAARERCSQYTWPRVRGQWIAVYRAASAGRLTAAPPIAEEASGGSKPAPPITTERSRDARHHSPLSRLRAMGSREIAFRARTRARNAARRIGALAGSTWRRSALARRLTPNDPSLRPVVARLRRRDWIGAHRDLTRHFQNRSSRFVIDPRFRSVLVPAIVSRFPRAAEEAQERGDRLAAGKYDLLGYRDLEFRREDRAPGLKAGRAGEGRPDPSLRNGGADIDWKFDPVQRLRAADAWWTAVHYLQPTNGDHKVIWELNRHQHWLALGRAYWLTGREEYRLRFVAELESWLAQNPPLVGINWTSMLELGLRGISWLWALHFFLRDPLDSSQVEDDVPWLVDLLLGLDRQMRHVEENLSHYFSPNTHLTGEALGLYVVGRVVPELRRSDRWQAIGRRVLIEQAAAQIAADGGHAERSAHYHRYTLDFYLLALAVARKTGDAEGERAFEPVVARLARFAWALADTTGYLPRIGDDDGGSLLPLCGSGACDVRPSISIAASLLPGQVPAEEFAEESLWVVGPDAPHERASASGSRHAASREWERSTAFPTTGYFVSRSRSGDHLVFDAGPHGFLNGGHAHADALAVTLAIRWHRFLIDPGTGTYTMDAGIRDRFRSTALHNTLELDGRSQSTPDGPFHWETTANGRALRCAFNPRFDFFEASHDGYAPATHRRAVFNAAGELWLVADHVLDTTGHSASVQWHLDPRWDVRIEAPVIGATHVDGLSAVLATTARQIDVFRGDSVSGLGWCSPVYGQLVSCPTVRFSKSGTAPFSIATLILPAHDVRHVWIEQVPVVCRSHQGPGTRDQGPYAFAVRVARPGAVDVALFTVPAEGGPAGWARSAKCVSRFAGFETDARFAYVRCSASGAVRAVSLVDGSSLLRLSGDPFRLELEHETRDLSVVLDQTGLFEVFGSGPLPVVGLDAPAYVVNRVRVNDLQASFRRADGAVVVPAMAGVAARGRAVESPVGAS